ncbi:hypothetical protein KJ909_02490 [Patescibacteria group bacterium]|nr:hypothetical protein [Patescibacteria group bacterium]
MLTQKTNKTIISLLLLPLLIFSVQKIIQLQQLASDTYANIIINTQKTDGPLPRSLWANFSQGGEEASDMLAPVLSQVTALQPQYIRIDHLFDFYDVYQGPSQFNFTKLDQVIDTILATSATPFLSLSYTPASITQNGQNASAPQDWNLWYQIVKATANRYSVEKNIKNIYYEVWNEPDLFGSWHYQKNPSYLTLYTHTAQAVVDGAVGSQYKIGGPATTAFYKNWLIALLNHCQTQNLPLDFISFHLYSPHISDFQKDLISLDKILQDYPRYQHLEKIISESGPYSDPHSGYDNSFSALHFLSLATSLSPQNTKLFTFEIVDGPTPRSDLSSGWGLIPHPKFNSQPKPRYQAFLFLNQLKGDQLLSSGDGSWVSSLSGKNGQTIQTLLVNYDPNGQHYEKIPLTYQYLSPGSYQLKTINFLGKTETKNLRLFYSHHTEFVSLLPNSALILELSPSL